MGDYVAEAVIKQLVLANKTVRRSRVAILGLTFKENCPDIRNSKVVDIVRRLRDYGLEPIIVDPEADPEEAKREYGLELTPLEAVHHADCLVFAVAHERFKSLSWAELDRMYVPETEGDRILVDVKSIFPVAELTARGYRYWRL